MSVLFLIKKQWKKSRIPSKINYITIVIFSMKLIV